MKADAYASQSTAMFSRRRILLTATLTFCAVMCAFVCGCGKKQPPLDQPAAAAPIPVRIGYRASLPADVGPLWAHEAGALKDAGFASSVQAFGPPHVLLQALRNNEIDAVAVMPLEPVLEDIRTGKANYLIYCLQCFSPTEEFDAIVAKAKPDQQPTWQTLSGALGVIPASQNVLIGKAIVQNVGVEMEVRNFNPMNPLLSLGGADFAAVHVLGADVARARLNPAEYTIIEYCPASRRVFDNQVTPAGVGLISKAWVEAHPDHAAVLVDTMLSYSTRSRKDRQNAQLISMLQKAQYGQFTTEEAAALAFAPLIPYREVNESHFDALMTFLEGQSAPVPAKQAIMATIFGQEEAAE